VLDGCTQSPTIQENDLRTFSRIGNAEAVEAAIRKHKRQQALRRIEEDVMGDGAAVSRETFDAAQNEWRGADAERR
jgi:hypothetical protein